LSVPTLGERFLRERDVSFTSHPYDYRKKGTEAASLALGIPEAAAIKTLVVKLEDGRFVFLLACGDREVSMRSLARELGVKGAELATERDAERLTGYQLGGMGPFGSRTALPVCVDLAVLGHDRVYVNGGKRGLLVGMDPETLVGVSGARLVDVAVES
jgi:Cys-tRNA(Pro) deacylase